MRKRGAAARMALCGVLAALAVALMFLGGTVPFASIACPVLASLVLIPVYCECGWKWGLLVGFVTPLLRSVLFGMPPMVPTALAMAFELAAYGAVAGLCYRRWRGSAQGVYLSLILAMLVGRLVWGLVSIPIYGLLTEQAFTLAAFWTGGFVTAWPGIVLQIVLIPAIVLALEKAKLFQQQ